MSVFYLISFYFSCLLHICLSSVCCHLMRTVDILYVYLYACSVYLCLFACCVFMGFAAWNKMDDDRPTRRNRFNTHITTCDKFINSAIIVCWPQSCIIWANAVWPKQHNLYIMGAFCKSPNKLSCSHKHNRISLDAFLFVVWIIVAEKLNKRGAARVRYSAHLSRLPSAFEDRLYRRL